MEGTEAPSGGSPPWANITGIQFGLMTRADTVRMSVAPDNPDASVKPKDVLNANLGLPTASGKCLTCNGITVDECQGHFGHIRLSLPIFHPNHVEALVRLLRKICLNCGQLRKKNNSKDTGPKLRTGSSNDSKKRKRSSTLDPDPDHEGLPPGSTADAKRKQKVDIAIAEDAEDWPEAPEKCELPKNLILLSDSDEELICKTKHVKDVEISEDARTSTSQAGAEIPANSKKNKRKRKFPEGSKERSSKTTSRFGESTVVGKDSATESYRKTEKFSDNTDQTPNLKSGKRFCDGSKSLSKIRCHSSKVCKYCSEAARRHGYPEPEISVHVTSKGTTKEDPLGLVKVIKMRVKSDEEEIAIDYWDFVEGSSKTMNKKGSRYLLPSEALKMVQRIPEESIASLGMKANIAHPEALIVEYIPVPPNCTRLHEDALSNIGFNIGVDRATQAFERLLRKITSLRTARYGKPVFQAALMECSVLQALFQQYLREKGAPKAAPGKEKNRVDQSGRLQKRASRWSSEWLKKNIIGKRSGFSARNVVTGDPFLGVEEIGVPLDIAKHVTYSERVTRFNRSNLQKYIEIGQDLGDSRACGAVRIVRDGERREVTRKTGIELEIGDIVHRHLKDGDLVFINRPPSLHKHSLLALRAHIHTEATWTINPAICSPLHADFDGDCLHVFVPQTEESKAELHQLMTLPAQILPSPSESTILGLSQDYILAVYLVTSSPLFLTKEEMHQLGLWATKPIPVPTIVKSPKAGPLWTGKQVIDLTIPENLTFQCSNKKIVIQDGEILCCGEKPNWLASTKGLVRIVALDNTDLAVKHLDCLQSVLREWLLTHGFSVSLEDFYAAPDQHQRRNMKQKIEASLEYAKCMAVGKQFIFDKKIQKDKSRSMSSLDSMAATGSTGTRHGLDEVAITCFRQSQSQIGETFVESISDCNNLLAMVRSGSKGSSSKVMQQIGSLGIQFINGDKLLSSSKHPKLVALAAAMGYSSDKDLPDAWEIRGLVKSSLLDGLEPHEFFTHAISVRDGIFRQSQEITGPGELFKNLMLFLRDVHISYDGTVRNRGGLEIIQFQYEGMKSLTEEDTSKYGGETVMAGEAVGILAATAISQPAYQVMLEASPGIGSRKIRPLDLLQETMFPRSTAKLKASDRRSIMRLSRCECDDKYCGERRILSLQAELQPVTVEMLATEIAVEYASESSERWETFDIAAKEIKRTQLLPWIGHIQLDKMLFIEKKINPALILERLEATVKVVKNVSRRCRLGGLIFCFRNVGECDLISKNGCEKAPEMRASAPCLHFSLLRDVRKKGRNIKTRKQMDNETAEMLDIIQGVIIPMILNTVVKGFNKIESASIVWEEKEWSPPGRGAENDRFSDKSDGELVLEVTVNELYCTRRGMPWKIIQESCLHVMDYVDWRRSSPYSIQEINTIFGVDAAQDVLAQRLALAAGDHVGKKHLKLVADLMAHSGEIHGLTSYGYRDWMHRLQIPIPFTAGVFRAPMKHFMEAGRRGVAESFKGVLASSVFGKRVPVGTGADFMVNLNTKPQFKSRLAFKKHSSCSPESDSGQSIDILDHLVQLNAEIAAEYPPVISPTHEESNAFDTVQVQSKWGPSANTPESEGGWAARDTGSNKLPTVDSGTGDGWGCTEDERSKPSSSWGVEENDTNQTEVLGSNDSNSPLGAQKVVTAPGGEWGFPEAETPNLSGGWGE